MSGIFGDPITVTCQICSKEIDYFKSVGGVRHCFDCFDALPENVRQEYHKPRPRVGRSV